MKRAGGSPAAVESGDMSGPTREERKEDVNRSSSERTVLDNESELKVEKGGWQLSTTVPPTPPECLLFREEHRGESKGGKPSGESGFEERRVW